ncbi:hypothetical protein H8959_001272 [Pygathrix nigripes]
MEAARTVLQAVSCMLVSNPAGTPWHAALGVPPTHLGADEAVLSRFQMVDILIRKCFLSWGRQCLQGTLRSHCTLRWSQKSHTPRGHRRRTGLKPLHGTQPFLHLLVLCAKPGLRWPHLQPSLKPGALASVAGIFQAQGLCSSSWWRHGGPEALLAGTRDAHPLISSGCSPPLLRFPGAWASKPRQVLGDQKELSTHFQPHRRTRRAPSHLVGPTHSFLPTGGGSQGPLYSFTDLTKIPGATHP